MSILQRDIPRSTVIDLFAGSGALGLEALSRGAKSARFVESDSRTIRVLEKNIEMLKAAERAAVTRSDAIRFASDLSAHAYDVAFADPPYAGGWAANLVGVWLETPFARILSVEHGAREKLPGPGDTRRYGDTAITIYRSED